MTKLIIMAIIGAVMIGKSEIDTVDTVSTVEGKFYGSLELVNAYSGAEETLYQFKSNDDEVWWLLSEKEIGCIPTETETYTLTYNNGGTTKENKPCDCTPDLECECELYDDVFLGIAREDAEDR